MNTPPFLVGAALLFWGSQTGLLPFAAGIALLLEGSRLVPGRREFSQRELDRIYNLCTLIFLGAVAYAFSAGDEGMTRTQVLTRGAQSVFLFFQWMPLYFIPLVAAQAWGGREGMPISTFSWWLRKRRGRARAGETEATVNVAYAYFGVCILGASAAQARSRWFAASLIVLLAWGFWSRRSRSASTVGWAISLATAAALGLATQRGLVSLQAELQRLDTALVARFSRGTVFDVNESRTMIGTIGKLKLSSKILFRVRPEHGAPPELLREGSYNLFRSPVWGCSKREFQPVFRAEETTWPLLDHTRTTHQVIIAGPLPGGQGVLPLPQGVARLEKLPVFALERNRLGAVRSEAGPGFVEFVARYQEAKAIDAPPHPAYDREVPAGERPALARIVAELGLADQTPEQAVQTVSAFFSRHFEYSAWLGNESGQNPGPNAISSFLLERRKGHCEYFATATTLLLRQAGIPARYAVGYAVQERQGGEYVVRARHGHAWCLAWVNGAWREVDTTPGVWVPAEAAQASFWEPLSDIWSRCWFAFSKWRWGPDQVRQYILWALGILIAAVLVGLLSAKGWRPARRSPRPAPARDSRSGLDSEFYLVERRLAERGLDRNSGETALAWLRRLATQGLANTEGLDEALRLHYRLRFDPRGIRSADRALLSQFVRQWLDASETGSPHRECSASPARQGARK